jgi:hypothetical protein
VVVAMMKAVAAVVTGVMIMIALPAVIWYNFYNNNHK